MSRRLSQLSSLASNVSLCSALSLLLACSTNDGSGPGGAGATSVSGAGGMNAGSANTGGNVTMAGSAGMGGTIAGGGTSASGAGGMTPGGAGGMPGGANAGGQAGSPMGGANAGGANNGGASMGGNNMGGADTGGTGPFDGENFVPASYEGTPFSTLRIPGTFFAADYDRGGAGVAYCHGNENDCGAGTVTGDWYPGDSGPYREPMPAGGAVCGGAACDDNIGLCRMNPGKPDNTIAGVPVTDDVYLCYMTTNEWLKYTVEVTEAGTYSVGVFAASPGGVTISLDFGAGITSGTFAVPESSTANCACTESYHAWAESDDLATVTFPAPGVYLMTFTVESVQFNIDKFTFTKM